MNSYEFEESSKAGCIMNKFEIKENCIRLLNENNINWVTKNDGIHIMIKEYGIDFWPTTGKWMTKDKKRFHGVERLIQHIKSNVLSLVETRRPQEKVGNRKNNSRRPAGKKLANGEWSTGFITGVNYGCYPEIKKGELPWD